MASKDAKRIDVAAFLRDALRAMDDFIEAILNRYGWTAR